MREGSARREAALEAARGATSDALARAEVAETQLEAMRDEAGRRDARAAVRGETPKSPKEKNVSEDTEHAAELVRETRRLGGGAAAKLEAQRARRVERAAQERVAHLERVAAERESRVVQLEESMAADALARDVERDDAARALRAARRGRAGRRRHRRIYVCHIRFNCQETFGGRRRRRCRGAAPRRGGGAPGAARAAAQAGLGGAGGGGHRGGFGRGAGGRLARDASRGPGADRGRSAR